MNKPSKRTELLLAAVALLLVAGMLLAAGARSAMTQWQTQPEPNAIAQNPFEPILSGTAAPVIDKSQAYSSYAVGYTGVVVYPPSAAPAQPNEGEITPPQLDETQPGQTQPPQIPMQPAYPVNLNTATQAQLETLPGIGPVKAQAILAWRAANGGFANANQLLQVSGIGQKTLEGLLPYITW